MKEEKTMTGRILDKTLCLSTLVCLLPIVLSWVVYPELPERVAVQWGVDGLPSNYAPRAFAAFGLPLLLAAVNVITQLSLNGDPKRQGQSAVLRRLARWLIPVVSLVMVPVTLFIAMGAVIPVEKIALPLVGVLFLLFGNYLPKCRRNYTMGIKLPWTLDSEENWNKTHRMAGFLWMAGGVVWIVCAFCGWYLASGILVVLMAALPALYSFLLYCGKRKRTE